MSDKYILNDVGEAVPENDLASWAAWFGRVENRVVEQTDIGDRRVSTVFLGLDHSFGEGPPILWETMIFGGEHDGSQWRYESLEHAKAGHALAVRLAKGEVRSPDQ